MMLNLLEEKAKILLEKFGRGSHKPGSGSAAALEGLLSAQLILTVIKLTCDPKRRKTYGIWLQEFENIRLEIQNVIYPKLIELCEKDSVEFGKVITLRNQRDSEKNFKKKLEYQNLALQQLQVATEITHEIASLCLRLGEHSVTAIEKGFRAARGDSNVALNGSLSAAAGCISIIYLNLASDKFTSWSQNMRTSTNVLREKYDLLAIQISKSMDSLRIEADVRSFRVELESMFKPNTTYQKSQIEQIANRVRELMWQNKNSFWTSEPPSTKIDVLQPEIALAKFNYNVTKPLDIETEMIDGQIFEVAGLIDMQNREVKISQKQRTSVQNFTTAHELGHAILHRELLLHRDRPIDKHGTYRKNKIESQADIFAAFFLMPEALVKEQFVKMFGVKSLTLDEDTLFLMGQYDIQAFRKRYRSKLDIAYFVASLNIYNSVAINSLAQQFRVSAEAMAIRLRDLNLINY